MPSVKSTSSSGPSIGVISKASQKTSLSSIVKRKSSSSNNENTEAKKSKTGLFLRHSFIHLIIKILVAQKNRQLLMLLNCRMSSACFLQQKYRVLFLMNLTIAIIRVPTQQEPNQTLYLIFVVGAFSEPTNVKLKLLDNKDNESFFYVFIS